jgi:hypothetical protein
MSTILTSQERVSPLILDGRTEPSSNVFSGVMDVITEIGYCLKLSAQSLSFNASAPTASSSSAARLDSWPVDLWVF